MEDQSNFSKIFSRLDDKSAEKLAESPMYSRKVGWMTKVLLDTLAGRPMCSFSTLITEVLERKRLDG